MVRLALFDLRRQRGGRLCVRIEDEARLLDRGLLVC